MNARNLPSAALLLVLAAGCSERAPVGAAATPRSARSSGGAAGSGAAPYDLTPLLSALRPGMAEQIKKQLGVADLADLPFYDLDLALDGAGDELAGRLTLYYRNRTGQAISALPLLLHANAPLELGAAGGPGQVLVTSARAISGPPVKVRPMRATVVELTLERPLRAGERITLEVRFKGTLRKLPAGSNDLIGQALASLGTSGSGAAASDYGLLASGDGIITVASAYPMLAPFHQGRFDVGRPSRFGDLAYSELSHFRARVVLPPGLKVITNLLDSPHTSRTAAGQVVHSAVGAGNRDFALVAGADLVREARDEGGTRVSSVHRRGDAEAGRRALDTAARSLRLFERRFGPYPYRELDVAEATLVGGAGGVEFPGMVLIAGMLYRPPSQSSSPLAHLMRLVGGLGGLLGGIGGDQGGRRSDEAPTGLRAMDPLVRDMAFFTVAHEVAHQYFAGLVGTDCRHEPGVDEPAAQFAAGEVAREVMGEKKGDALVDSQVKMNYGIYRMLGGKDRQVAQPVFAFGSALAYAAIVYGKAPYFYRELRKRLGTAAFDRALRATVDAHRFQVVTLSRWLATLDTATGGRSRDLARRWFYEQHGDEDLGVDESGDQVLAAMLGREMVEQLKQGLGMLGMQPRDLFRMLMGNMLKEEGGAAGAGQDAEQMLDDLQKLRH